MSGGFYRQEGEVFHPLTPATGSWNRNHQNGVAVGGLLAHLLEGATSPYPARTARLGLDILRPAPFAPIEGRVEIEREDNRGQVLAATLLAEGVVVARARTLRLPHTHDTTAPIGDDAMVSPPGEGAPPITRALGPGAPMETRLVHGSRRQIGPGAYWTRMNVDLVRGRPLSPLVSATMAADVASGPSTVLDFEHWTYANIDSVLYLTREPRGCWMLVEARTETAGEGVGVATSRLSDRWGGFGFSQQTLFVAPRQTPRRAA